MEEEKSKIIFSSKVLILLFLAMFLSHCHGFGTDQASSLTSFRRAKRRASATTSATDLHTTITKTARNNFDNSDQALKEPTLMDDDDVGKMEDDLLEKGLPGQPLGVMFKQYSGYVNVNKVKGRSLFYYFAEAVEDPDSKPLLLWLNGGPGCSSLGYGAMLELGPFGVNPDGKTLYLRKFPWNKVANTLFLESPAGVGFSYSNTTDDYKLSGDTITAEDSYTFLVNWLKKFPHYQGRDFYIMGESYAGYYVPELADVIVNKNKAVFSNTKIRLKGIMIGNGIMDDVTDARGTYDFIWSHALISDETYRRLKEHCTIETNICEEYETEGKAESGTIDYSNIYGPICSTQTRSSSSQWRTRLLYGYDPCEQNYVTRYLNLPHVQDAMHANRTKLPNSWKLCSDVIGNWKDSPPSIFPHYTRLIATGLRILLFSGDVDTIVSVTSTRYSIDAMNLKVLKPWHPWLDDTNQVGGYEIVYEGLTFATVRDAGHQVPQYQPQRAFSLVKRFLAQRNHK